MNELNKFLILHPQKRGMKGNAHLERVVSPQPSVLFLFCHAIGLLVASLRVLWAFNAL